MGELKKTNKLNWEDFKYKFHESWHEKIKPVIESEYMFELYQKLKLSKEQVLPKDEDVFRSFTGKLDDIHAVLILQDPYPWVKNGIIIADGIPMSCSHSNEQQPSLKKFYEAMGEELKIKPKMSTDLSYLINQGCFLINTALTVKRNKKGSHSELWKHFMKHLFSEILKDKTGIVYWFMGEVAYEMKKYIPNELGNYLIKTSHPASAAYKHTNWDSEGMFIKINNVIKNNFGEANQIIWDENQYIKELNEIPF